LQSLVWDGKDDLLVLGKTKVRVGHLGSKIISMEVRMLSSFMCANFGLDSDLGKNIRCMEVMLICFSVSKHVNYKQAIF